MVEMRSTHIGHTVFGVVNRDPWSECAKEVRRRFQACFVWEQIKALEDKDTMSSLERGDEYAVVWHRASDTTEIHDGECADESYFRLQFCHSCWSKPGAKELKFMHKSPILISEYLFSIRAVTSTPSNALLRMLMPCSYLIPRFVATCS